MPDNIVEQISKELSRIFRFMLPGMAILGLAMASHPSWYPPWSTLNGSWQIAILGAMALTVGNAWYVVHKFTLHQLFDYYLYCRMDKERKVTGYKTWLGNHIDQSFQVRAEQPELSEHVHLRSAQLIFLFIVAEAIIVFSIKPECCTFFARYR